MSVDRPRDREPPEDAAPEIQRSGASAADIVRVWELAERQEDFAAHQDAWREHVARWPAQRASAEIREGEPGSWRGESGRYLNAEENLVTEHARERVVEHLPKIAAVMEEVGGDSLVGLEYQLKGEERYKDKVAAQVRARPEESVGEAAGRVADVLRYTCEFSEERYVDGFRRVCEQLEERSIRMEVCKNLWDEPLYKGVNTQWRSAEGQAFELQFHTGASFEAKQLTHEAYERSRDPLTSGAELEELDGFQEAVSRSIPRPERVEEIADYDGRRA